MPYYDLQCVVEVFHGHTYIFVWFDTVHFRWLIYLSRGHRSPKIDYILANDGYSGTMLDYVALHLCLHIFRIAI